MMRGLAAFAFIVVSCTRLAGQVGAIPTGERVTLTVAAQLDGRPIAGLRADEFRVSEEGVAQTVESASTSDAPIDLTVIVDPRLFNQSDWKGIAAGVDAMSRGLRSTDRVRVLGLSASVVTLVPWEDGGQPLTVPPVLGGKPLLFDALFIASVHEAPGRRHLVVTFGPGEDGCGVTSGSALRGALARSPAVLHWIRVSRTGSNAFGTGGLCAGSGRPIPAVDLGVIVPQTGGRVYEGWLRRPDMAGSARTLLEEFRASYLVTYRRSDATAKGLRRVEVRSTRKGVALRTRAADWAGD